MAYEKPDDCYMLWLSRISGMTNLKALTLLEQFGTAKRVFFSDEDELVKTTRINSDLVDKIKKERNEARIEQLVDEAEAANLSFISIENPEYPHLLKTISNPPVCLYYAGTLPDNRIPNVSIVGTRRCSEYGMTAASKIARDLARAGITIVSGMAEGIDTMAHKGALEEDGFTIAVLGCGVDICYPKSSRYVMDEIIQKGCILSEFPPNTKPLPSHFPQRNRIISGLSYSSIIVEAGEKSGADITAVFALEQGRDVFAVPGNIFSKQSRGTNNLIKEGAYPLTSYMDILYHLKSQIHYFPNAENLIKNELIEKKQNVALAPEEKLVYDCISLESVTVDELFAATGEPIQSLFHILTKLEFKGYIKRQPGQRYIRSL